MKKIFCIILTVGIAVHGFCKPKAVLIEQTKTYAMLGEKLASKAVAVSDGENVRWQVISPYKSILIINKNGVFQFEESNNTLRQIKNAAPEKTKQITKMILNMISGDFSEFECKTENGKIWLTPKDELVKKFAAKIEITLKDKTPVKAVVYEQDSDATEMLFSEKELGKNAANSAFDETKPELFKLN